MIRYFAALGSLLCVTTMALSAAHGGEVYEVSANTTAIAGTTGALDLAFNPGGVGTLAATATITAFVTDGTGLSLNTTDGDVSGTLSPGPLAINNTFGLNDLLENITFGTNISFALTLSGAGVTSPVSTLPGSSFAFSLYDSSFNPLLTTDPAGTLVTVNLNPDGSTTSLTFPSTLGGSPAGSVTPLGGPVVPEPGSIALVLSGALTLGAVGKAAQWRRRCRSFMC